MSLSGKDTGGADDLAIRLTVLEMTVAAIAARLPEEDLEELVSMLVFVARSSDAVGDLEGLSEEEGAGPGRARHYVTEMLERISKSRRSVPRLPVVGVDGPPGRRGRATRS